MKKIVIIIFLFLLTGCFYNKDKMKYDNYIKELNKVDKSSNNLIFDINVNKEKLTDNIIRYEMVLDSVTNDITDVEAIIIHDKITDDIYPSIGIFDEKINLFKNKKPKGIILVGYINYKDDINNFDATFKVLVKYKINNKVKKIYYVTK